MPEPPVFSPELAEATRQRLRELLGSTWERIQAEDEPLRLAGRPDRERHLLAILDQRAEEFAQEYRELRLPGHLGDFLAYRAAVEIFDRSHRDEIFREVVPTLANRGDFRHAMLTLGLADHVRSYTKYPVRLPIRNPAGGRVVDLIIGEGATIEIETKSSNKFDGPLRHVRYTDAFNGIRIAWNRALGGENPQLTGVRPNALLVGGVTVEVASLPTIVRAAKNWLERKGADHPNFWGILVLTYQATTVLPAGRSFGDGQPLTFNSYAGVQLRAAQNRYYTGSAQIILTPSVVGH